MSFVIAVPEALTMAASDLANIGSTINAANAAAALPTTGVVAAAADEVSAAVAALFGSYAQSYQAFGGLGAGAGGRMDMRAVGLVPVRRASRYCTGFFVLIHSYLTLMGRGARLRLSR